LAGSYADGLELQKQLVEARRSGAIGDTLLLLQHPHVLTLGVKKDGRSHILGDPDRLAGLGVEVFDTGRGGDVTYHGPGRSSATRSSTSIQTAATCIAMSGTSRR
jgi:lipoyl(octanoyl) transferase